MTELVMEIVLLVGDTICQLIRVDSLFELILLSYFCNNDKKLKKLNNRQGIFNTIHFNTHWIIVAMMDIRAIMLETSLIIIVTV